MKTTLTLGVGAAAVIFLLGFGAGARWRYWWAIAAALWAVKLLVG